MTQMKSAPALDLLDERLRRDVGLRPASGAGIGRVVVLRRGTGGTGGVAARRVRKDGFR